MINSRKELEFYLKADRMMNTGSFSETLQRKFMHLFFHGEIMDFLVAMRKFSYYSHQHGIFCKLLCVYNKYRYLKLSKKLGFSIGADCFGYGLVIHHHGTIVVGGNNSIGNFALLNTSSCITKNGSTIGNFLFLGTGAVISKRVTLGHNVKVAANSVVNREYNHSNIVLAGQPAVIKKNDNKTWMECYSISWFERYMKVLELKNNMNLTI